VPYKCNSIDGQIGRVNTQVMYDNVMNKFKWGNMANPDVYLDETNMRMCTNLRNIFCRLAFTLVYEGKMKEAVKVADKCTEVMPDNCVPYNAMVYPLADVFYKGGEIAKANAIIDRLITYSEQELIYYSQFTGGNAAYLEGDKKESYEMLKRIIAITAANKQTELYNRAVSIANNYRM
jgi:hypothetical protein